MGFASVEDKSQNQTLIFSFLNICVNTCRTSHCSDCTVFDMSKIQIQKQITTMLYLMLSQEYCVWYVKDTNSKANHNECLFVLLDELTVFDMSKIQIQKQITTLFLGELQNLYCVWYVKDTNSKANHNARGVGNARTPTVFDMSKIQIQKQITTGGVAYGLDWKLCLICQRYKFKSKSQRVLTSFKTCATVFDMSKIQIQKQITTMTYSCHILWDCVWYVKDTNSKANHNFNWMYWLLVEWIVFKKKQVYLWRIHLRNPK